MKYPHNLTHDHKLSCDMGELVPAACIEVLPGDEFVHRTSLFARVAPLVNPVMHDVDLRVHHWYVPNRLLWSGWEDFIVGNGGTHPTVTVPADSTYLLLDHMGLPPATGASVNALPVRAYNKIWNEYYRDQDLSTERTEDQLGLARICWEKDYFTTARDVAQQGSPVTVGFSSGLAPVQGIGTIGTPATASNTFKESDGGTRTFDARQDSTGSLYTAVNASTGYPEVFADLTQMSGGFSLDDFRQAMALQSFAEVRSRFGDRYVDYLRYLGINPGDSRLQRPEFLGGGSQSIQFSEVIAMAEGATTEVGDLYGHGIAGLRARRYRRRFPEHGWVLTLLSARPRTAYMNGIGRKWSRASAMDYWQKELELLPWQEVTAGEIYHAAADVDAVFGYQGKFDEYRHEYGYVSGNFRTGPEIDWHMARNFTSEPTLNESFVTCTPTDRIYGDTSMPELLINCIHQISARRLVRSNPRFGAMAL